MRPHQCDLDALFNAMAGQVMLDAWIQSTSAYWEKRARDYEWVITGDRDVRPTAEQLEERPGTANLIWFCRHRATLIDQARAEYFDTLAALSAGDAA